MNPLSPFITFTPTRVRIWPLMPKQGAKGVMGSEGSAPRSDVNADPSASQWAVPRPGALAQKRRAQWEEPRD